MTGRSLADRLRRPALWSVLFWVAFAGFGAATVVHDARKAASSPLARGPDTAKYVGVSDFQSFLRSAERMVKGETVYFPHTADNPELPNKHPPFLPLVMRPFLLLDVTSARVVWDVAMLGLLVLCLLLGQRIAEQCLPAGVHPWTARVTFLLLVPYFHRVLRYGQVGVLVLAALLVGLWLWRRRPWLSGLAFGLAVAIKVIPVVVLAWLLWKRSWRAAGGCVLAVVLTTAAVFVDQGWAGGLRHWRDWQQALRADRALEADCAYVQRFRGLTPLVACTVAPELRLDADGGADPLRWDGMRNFAPSAALAARVHLLVALASALIGLVCGWACWPGRRAGGRAPPPLRATAELGLVAVAMLLVCPQTWTHYLVWLFPALLPLVLLQLGPRPRPRWATVALATYVVLVLAARRRLLPEAVLDALVAFQAVNVALLLVWGILAWALIADRLDRPARAPTA